MTLFDDPVPLTLSHDLSDDPVPLCPQDLHHEQDVATCGDLGSGERLAWLAGRVQGARRALGERPGRLAALYCLGQLRHALAASAHLLHRTFLVAGGAPVVGQDLEELLAVLRDTCLDTASGWPKSVCV